MHVHLYVNDSSLMLSDAESVPALKSLLGSRRVW